MNTATQVIAKAQEQGLFDNYAPDYAEPGYSIPEGSKGILFANWNEKSNYDENYNRLPSSKADKLMPRLEAIAERAGYEIEWLDEWSTCSDCYKAFRTNADSNGWLPCYVWIGECDMVCHQCLLDNSSLLDEYLENELIGNANKAITIDGIANSLPELGWRKVEIDYETGLHQGMNDKPQDIAAKLEKSGIDRYIFEVSDASQFYITWQVWVEEKDLELAINTLV